MWLLLDLELSDDDVEWPEIAEQCGFDVPIAGVDDVEPPIVLQYHDQPCLALQLHSQLTPAQLQPLAEQLKQRMISHPSVSAERVIAVLATKP